MGVPLNHPLTGFSSIFHYKPTSYWGVSIHGNSHNIFASIYHKRYVARLGALLAAPIAS